MISFEPLFILLKERGISLLEFSKLTKITYPTIHRMKKENVTYTGTLDKICKALNVGIADIVRYDFEDEVSND